TIAMADLAHSAPDGYTIAFASQGTLVFNLALYSKPGYDSLKDFAPILLVGGVSNVMVVPPTSTAATVTDVIAAAKAHPGMTFSSGGSGTSHHLSGVLFGQLTGTDLLHVPYKGAPQGIMAVMTGEVNMGFYNTPTVISQIRDHKLKALAVTSLTRSPLLPDVPTLDASGVKGYEVNTWFGFVAPAGTPQAVVTTLHDDIAKILAMRKVRDNLVAQGFDLAPTQPPEAFTNLIRTDLAKWPPIIKAAGAKVD
ncbi:MAG TPA: tripartite tricarboxylate transporter substrate-binding protein, partial [Ramlibacter sp.]|nr:tripartite tricarboxylate transporter substrate-binding protein [Ramlibacter sp.]